VKTKLVLLVVAFGLWCALTWPPDWQHLIVGVLVAGAMVIICADLFDVPPAVTRQPMRYFYFAFYYIPFFLWECLKANVDVAYRVAHPALPIHPGIVKVKTTLKSDTGLTFLANSITLTPGTMTVDINREEGVIYIHWINVKSSETEAATKMIVERFERVLKKIFD
jgi:multicomponent Na+:H+ antiporter subunit E